MSDNRIYQLSNEQLNVISADLLEAIVLISGKKDKTGLLDELNEINGNLIDYLSQNKNIIDDLESLFAKVKADEKLKLKVKEIEIKQIKESDLFATIDELKQQTISLNNNADVFKSTNEMVSKSLVVSSNKIKDSIDESKKISEVIEKNVKKFKTDVETDVATLKTEALNFSKNLQKFQAKKNWIAYIGFLMAGFTIGVFTTFTVISQSIGKMQFNQIISAIFS